LPSTHAGLVPWSELHGDAQLPQWDTLIETSSSQPLPSMPSQLPKGGWHCATTQLPWTQAAEACGSAQAMAQPPQSVGVSMGVSQPSEGEPLQSSNPKGQLDIPHTPSLHEGCAPPSVEHELPH